MATTVSLLLISLSGVCAVSDWYNVDASVEDAKKKFSSMEYFYLDDPSPGDYFDSIASAAKVLNNALKEFSTDAVNETKRFAPMLAEFFIEVSLKTDDQGAPFGSRECRLLPKQFASCRIEPMNSENMSGLEKVLRDTLAWIDWIPNTMLIKLFHGLKEQCEALNIDSVFKMATALMGEHCEKGLSEDGSMEQNIQRRMMQYAQENHFEGGNENNCLPLFIARFTRSSQALNIFKTAVDRYLLATTTIYAFCTVIETTQSKEGNRAKAIEIHAAFAKSLARVQNNSSLRLNDSVSWACDTESKVDADVAALDVARVREIIDVAMGNTSSGGYFFDDAFAADYFDNIRTAAGYAALLSKGKRPWWVDPDPWVRQATVVEKAFESLFRELSSTTDEQATPFGINECWLLPAELNDSTIVPLMSTSVGTGEWNWRNWKELEHTLEGNLFNYDGAAKVCETLNVDGTLKTLRALIGNDCEEGLALNGTIESTCLHLFVARYTKSEEAVQMFKKSFDKYLMTSITVQAFCSVYTPKCDEEAYRISVLDTHASFAASLARTTSIQFNVSTPWNCDDSPQVTVANMNASIERITSTAASETYFLGEMTAEEFEDMTFATAESLTALHAEVFRSFENATTFFSIYELLGKVKDQLRQSRDRLNENDHGSLDVCLELSATQTNALLRGVSGFVAPGCQNGRVGDYDVDERWRGQLLGYARTHGFAGCEDNKCLQFFIARYTNHSRDAVERLQHSLDKYVYLSVFLKSFCASYSPGDEQQSERNKTTELVRSLGEGMRLIRNLSNDAGNVESCFRTTTKKPYYPTETTEPSTENRTTHEVPAEDSTTPEVPAKESTTHEDEPNWPEKVISYAQQLIEREIDRLKPRSWGDRQGLHVAVANGITERLNCSTNIKNYSCDALAYLPYADDERRGFIKLQNNDDVVRNEHKLVNYAVNRRENEAHAKVATQWTAIEKNADGILEATFSTRATNLTSRMKEVEERFGPFLKEDGFRALAALRCGYEFVWYELGYRYFPAGYATGKHTLFTDTGNKYSDKCGQIIFFP